MKPAYRSIPVTVDGARYSVTLRIFPAREPAHVGADSPRYGDPGEQERIEVMCIKRDGVVVDLPAVQREPILDAMVDELGRERKTRSMRVTFEAKTRQYLLPIGHLSRAFERTGGAA